MNTTNIVFAIISVAIIAFYSTLAIKTSKENVKS